MAARCSSPGDATMTNSGDATPKIATYVFFDLESTDLLHARTRITELCLVAVNRVDMQAAGAYPRVTNKLTLCFDPLKPMSASSSSITGLYNDCLENQKPFTVTTVQLLNSFLEHLQKPVCLLAHYGNGFDFPLLKQELQRISLSLDSSVLCADTLEAFRSLDGVEPGYGLPLCLCAMCSELRDSHNYTPIRNQTLPTPNTPVKRKIDKESDDNVNVKKLHQQGETCKGSEMSRQGDAVKKRLDFMENESKTEISQETANTTDNKNTATSSVKKRLFDNSDSNQALSPVSPLEHEVAVSAQFLASVEDWVHCEALDEIEKQLAEDIEDISESKDTAVCDDPDTNSTDSLRKSDIEDISESNKSNKSAVPNDPVSNSTGYIVKSANGALVSSLSSAKVYRRPSADSILPPTTLYTIPEVFNAPPVDAGPKHSKNAQHWTADVRLSTDVSSKCISPLEQNVMCSNVENDENNLYTSSISKESELTQHTANASDPDSNNSCVSSSTKSITTDNLVQNVSPSNSGASSNSSPCAGASVAVNNNSTPKRHSYKLEEIHKRVLGEKPTRSHCAEDDCIAMVKIAKCTRGFLEWVDSHARPLSSI